MKDVRPVMALPAPFEISPLGMVELMCDELVDQAFMQTAIAILLSDDDRMPGPTFDEGNSRGSYVCPYCGVLSDYPLTNHRCPYKRRSNADPS
jgi:hypothetical protein